MQTSLTCIGLQSSSVCMSDFGLFRAHGSHMSSWIHSKPCVGPSQQLGRQQHLDCARLTYSTYIHMKHAYNCLIDLTSDLSIPRDRLSHRWHGLQTTVGKHKQWARFVMWKKSGLTPRKVTKDRWGPVCSSLSTGDDRSREVHIWSTWDTGDVSIQSCSFFFIKNPRH